MAMDANVPLIPCATWGTQRILTKDRPKNFERHVAIDVYIGEPIDHEPGQDPGDVTARLMEAINVLVEKAQSNYPQHPKPGGDWWLPAHMGGSAPTVEVADEIARRDRERRKAQREERS